MPASGQTAAASPTTAASPPESTPTDAATSTPAPAEPQGKDAKARVEIIDLGFEPAETEVAAGGTVVWKQTGTLPHTVTFDSGKSSEEMAQGDRFRRTFEKPGTYSYICKIHPRSMKGAVTVTAP